jgi:hypothetical protein
MKKRYNTSLKSLLEDDDLLSEGFSRLSQLNLTTQRAAQCELNIPRELVQYLTKIKSLSEQEQERQEKAEKAEKAKKAGEAKEKSLADKTKSIASLPIEKFVEFTEGFLGASIGDYNAYSDLQKLVSLYFMSDVPAVYCDMLNVLAKRMDNIFKKLGVYAAAKEQQKEKTITKQVDLSIIKELNYSAQEEIKRIRPRIDTTQYTRLPIIANNDFLKSQNGKHFGFGLGLFRRFLSNYVSTSEFNADVLNEDYQEIEQLIESLKRISPTGLSDVYEDAGKEINLNFERYEEFDATFEKYQELDKNSDEDRSNAENFKNVVIADYVSFLLVIIKKVFYDKNIESTIPREVKDVIDRLERLLEKNGASLQRLGLN